MESILIGLLLIAGGVFSSVFVSKKIKNKNIEIQYMRTSTIGEVEETLKENEASGLQGYREYVELKGVADVETPQETPFSKRRVAYYEADLYQVYEELHTYQDDKGKTQQKMERRESRISNQKSSGNLILKDPQSGEQAYIRLTQMGMQLDTIKDFDKFEPQNMMQQYSFFNALRFTPMGSRTLGYRMTEKIIPLGHSLYVLGEAYLENGRLYIEKPADSKKPFIVSVKNESELVQSNKLKANLAFVGGIALGLIGIFVMLFG
ncbi:MAG TPA: hypothetical protein GXX46_06160 [Peptococcaceae bacterium]|nr:hypothetical protein [Peptococcaceae bacterium]